MTYILIMGITMDLIAIYKSQNGTQIDCQPNYGDGGYLDGYTNGYSDKHQESHIDYSDYSDSKS